MENLKAAVIGCGNIAPIHIAAIQSCENVELYAVCDTDRERANKFAEKYGVKAVYDYEKILGDPEVKVVHICTPHWLHKPMAVAAADTGKHIFLEKPAGLSTQEIKSIAAAVADNNVKCCVSFQNRQNPSIKYIKEHADELGKLIGIKGVLAWHRTMDYYNSGEWRGKWETEGGGLMVNQAIHTLDLLCYIGGEVESAKGFCARRLLDIEVEDTAECFIRFKSGATGIFFATNNFSTDSTVDIEMHFETGIYRYINNSLYDGSHNVIVSDDINTPGKCYWGTGHKELITNFYKNLTGEDAVYWDITEALSSMAVIEEIYKNKENC